jgi:hypothetical protein
VSVGRRKLTRGMAELGRGERGFLAADGREPLGAFCTPPNFCGAAHDLTFPNGELRSYVRSILTTLEVMMPATKATTIKLTQIDHAMIDAIATREKIPTLAGVIRWALFQAFDSDRTLPQKNLKRSKKRA